VILTAPVAVIAIWGGNYLLDCVRLLEAPGVPIELVYKTRGGSARLRAESYVLDWRRGTLRLDQPKLQDPKGGILAQLDHLVITGLRPEFGGQQVVRATARGLDARLVRLKSGRFEFEDFLPERKGPPGTIPFEIDLTDARVRLVDLAGPRRWEQLVTTNVVKVSGLGDDWVAASRVDARGIGVFPLRVQNVANFGLQIATVARDAELAPTIAHFVQTPPLRGTAAADFRARSLRVSGPVRVFLPQSRAAQAETRLVARGEGVSYREYAADAVRFDGLVTSTGASGKVDARVGSNRGRFDGSATWNGPLTAGGQLAASTPGRDALPAWVRRLVPAELDYRGATFRGWVAYSENGCYRVSGRTAAASARYRDESIQNASADVSARPDGILLTSLKGTYSGQPIAGNLAYGPKSGTLAGGFSAGRVQLDRVAARLGLRGLMGTGELRATLAGTLERPDVAFSTRGQATYQYGGRRFDLGRFEADGRFRNNTVALQRGLLDGPSGLVSASGSVGTEGAVGVDVVMRNFALGTLDPRVAGRANGVARLAGTLDQPRASGYLEAYNVVYQDQLLPFAAADFRVDRGLVALTDIRAVQGPTDIAGRATLRLTDRSLNGSFRARGIQPANFLGEEFAGVFDVPNLTVTGNLSRPVVQASLQGRNVVAQGVKLDSLEARVTARGDAITVNSAVARAAGGTVTASGNFDVSDKTGTLTLSGNDLQLDTVVPKLTSLVTVDGTLSGQVRARFANARLRAATGQGRIADAAVNGTLLGDGQWQVSTIGGRINGDLQIGSLDRYVQIQNAQYDPSTLAIAGDVTLLNVQLGDFTTITLPYLQNLSVDARDALRNLQGTLNLDASITGTTRSPGFDVRTFQASNLQYRERPIGNLETSLALRDRRWELRSLNLNGPLGNVTASGVVDERGETNLTGEVSGVPLVALSQLDPRLSIGSPTGTLSSFAFVAQGPTSSPRVRASLNLDYLYGQAALPDETEQQRQDRLSRGLSVFLDTIEISETRQGVGGISIVGGYNYRGFTGAITAQAPLEYPLRVPNDGRAQARVTLRERQLEEIAPLLGGFDPKRTRGTVGGELTAQLINDRLQVGGNVSLVAPEIGFSSTTLDPRNPGGPLVRVEDSLRNVNAAVRLEGDTVSLEANGDSSRGGRVNVNARTRIQEAPRFLANVREQGLQALLDNPVSGGAVLDQFAVRLGFPANGFFQGTASGTVALSGTFSKPRISGELGLAKVDSTLASFETRAGGSNAPRINPTFDLKANLTTPARLRSTAADLTLTGSGSLTGSLALPNARADLEVERGTIRLPGGTVRLEQGGAVAVSYRTTPTDAVAAVDVDLIGRTALTARRFGETYERYDITIGVRGDLLKEKGLNLTASSEPSDLSQDRILALLGQTDLLQSIGRGGDAERQIRDALAGYALPLFLDPVTSRLASGLGLEYLSFEYNAFEQASLAFAKVLGGGFTLQGRRQIGQAPPGFREVFDLRLVYRPRRARGILERFSFSVGADQDRPWKAALEYGTRF